MLAVAVAAPTAAPATAAPLVSYHLTGGLIGFDDDLVVRRDGRATLSSRGETRRFRLAPRVRRRLVVAVRRARFATLQPAYEPEARVSDGTTETVTHAGRTVRVETGAEIPRRLANLLSRLNRIVDRHRP